MFNKFQLSKQVAHLILFSLIVNSMPLAQARVPMQGSNVTDLVKSGFQAISKPTQQILDKTAQMTVPGLKGAISTLSSKMTDAVQNQITRFKNAGPNVIIPLLLEKLKLLGVRINDVGTCMIKGGGPNCTTQKRAALIATSIAVVTLVLVLIGYTVTTAATSQEIESHATKVSQEVKGYSPAAVFARTKNVIAFMQQELVGMKECLLKRQCTKTQKRTLYATAFTIAALVSIIAGIGIGSYIYAKQEEKVEQIEETKPEETGDIKKSMDNFEDRPMGLKTKFYNNAAKLIKPIQGVQTHLRKAYIAVKHEIQNGAVKSKEKASQVYRSLIDKAGNFGEIIKQTLDVNVQASLEKFQQLKQEFGNFSSVLSKTASSNIPEVANVKKIASLAQEISTKLASAQEAYKKLNITQIASAEINPDMDLIAKKIKLGNEQFSIYENIDRLSKEINNLQSEQAQALNQSMKQIINDRNQLVQDKATVANNLSRLKANRDNAIENINSIMNQDPKVKSDPKQVQVYTKQKDTERAKYIKNEQFANKKIEEINKKIASKDKAIEQTELEIQKRYRNRKTELEKKLAKNKKRDQEIIKLNENIKLMLQWKENTKYTDVQKIWKQLQPLLNQLALDSKPLAKLLNESIIKPIIAIATGTLYFAKNSGDIGLLMLSPETKQGLGEMESALIATGNNIQRGIDAITPQDPLITSPKISTTKLVGGMIKAATSPKLLAAMAEAAYKLGKAGLPIYQAKDQINTRVKEFQEAINNFSSSTIKAKFFDVIESKPIKYIPMAPVILFRIVAAELAKVKTALSKMLIANKPLMPAINELIKQATLLLVMFNNLTKSSLGNQLINVKVIDAIKNIGTTSASQLITGVQTVISNLEKNDPALQVEPPIDEAMPAK